MAKDQSGRIDNRIQSYTRRVAGKVEAVKTHYRSNRSDSKGASPKVKGR